MPITLLGDEADLSLDHPIIGWNNLATAVTATSEETLYPASNLLNPATHAPWISADTSPLGDHVLNITFAPATVDFVAIAKHNFNSGGISVRVGSNNDDSPSDFTELVATAIPASDGAALYRFTAQTLDNIEIQLTAGTEAPQAAAIYVGKLLVLPRKIYQNLTPVNYARTAKATNGKSEAGHFLGRIVLQEFNETKIPLALIDPAYFREHIAEFLYASQAAPFFFAWRPQTYPDEVGFCFMTNDPMPQNMAPHSLIGMTLEFSAVV